MKNNEKMENIKEWNDTTKNQEFTYPMWFKDRLNGHIVEFTEDRVGTVVYSPTGSLYKIGYYSENWASHINDEDYYWQQVENPNLEIENKEHKKDSSRGDGGSTNYYELPKDATELRHLIRYKKMSHPIGEIFCAIYRLNDNGESLRNLKKAKFYIDSEIEEYEKENK